MITFNLLQILTMGVGAGWVEEKISKNVKNNI